MTMPHFLNAFSYSKYEQNKRELVHWVIDKLPADQVSDAVFLTGSKLLYQI